MKIGNVITTAVNLGVIVLIGGYFVAVFEIPARTSAINVVESFALTDEEWASLTDGAGVIGSGTVRPSAVEFIDYQCQFCAQSHPMMSRFLRSQRDAAIAVRHFPLPTHPAAREAARAAICAQSQGAFAAFHRELLETTAWQSNLDFHELAATVGVADLMEFDACLRSPETDARLERDLTLAAEIGVRATPTFVSRRHFYEGSLTRRSLLNLMND